MRVPATSSLYLRGALWRLDGSTYNARDLVPEVWSMATSSRHPPPAGDL